MNEKIKDQVSAFLDDELPDGEAELLLRRLGTDPGLHDVAARYLLIGQALRGESMAGSDLGRRVADALAEEQNHAGVAVAAPPAGPRWLRPVAGVAVAAGVAVVALMSLQNTGEVTAPVPVTAEAVPGLATAPSEFEYVVPADATAVRPVSAVPARLTNYMISHGERAGTLVRSGMHSRIVTYGNDGGGQRDVTTKDGSGERAETATDE